MKKPELPSNETERLNALYSYDILDTLPEKDYDDITQLASEICQTPISLISLLDPNRQWFKSHHGLDATETPRELAFCAHAILKPDEVFVVNDSLKDDRFADNPLVTSNPNVIFYTGVPLINSEGMPLGTLCTIDHKPRELTHSQIQSLKALAHHVVSLMELRKANFALRKTQEELLNRNRELEKFAYVISHDIKSPLINIMSFSGLLKNEYSSKLDEKGIKFLDFLNQSSQKLNTMVDGLLAYYRGDNLLTAAIEKFDFKESIQSIINLLNTKDDCQIDYPQKCIEIKANKTVIEHILLNLVTNSIKYNDKELIIINIDFREDQNLYYFSVKDNGRGISKEFHSKIFELFNNLGSKDRFGNTGTGIGLSTIKKLVEAQGGKINISSEPQKGTTVDFTIKKQK
jgi:signal transduction histidine kinase